MTLANQIKAEPCPVCGTPCEVHSSREGTGSMTPIATELKAEQEAHKATKARLADAEQVISNLENESRAVSLTAHNYFTRNYAYHRDVIGMDKGDEA